MATSGSRDSVTAAIGQGRRPRPTESRTHPSSGTGSNCRRWRLANLRRLAGLSRPGIEIVDMVANVAAVAAEGRTHPIAPQLLHLARAEAKVETGLLRRKERATLLGPGGSSNVVFHPGSRVRTGRSFAHACRMARLSRAAEARKTMGLNAIRALLQKRRILLHKCALSSARMTARNREYPDIRRRRPVVSFGNGWKCPQHRELGDP